MFDKGVAASIFFLQYGFSCKSRLIKMKSSKANKIKKGTPLFRNNFSELATLLLGQKQYLYSKGPKNEFVFD